MSKKWLQRTGIFLAGALLLGGCVLPLAGCTTDEPAVPTSAATTATTGADPTGTTPAGKELVVLSDITHNPYQKDGCYMVDFPQGTDHQNILYYDYVKQEQRYFCTKEGCAHNTPECSSYLDRGGCAFAYEDDVLVFHGAYNDGSSENPEEWPMAIERFDRNGNGGTLLYTGGDGPGLHSYAIYTDGEALYFFMNETFLRVDMTSGEEKVVFREGDFAPDISTVETTPLPQVFEGNLLFLCSDGELNGITSLMAFDLTTSTPSVLHHWEAGESFPENFTPEGKGYYTDIETGEIRCHDIATDTDTLLTDAFAIYNTSVTEENILDGEGNLMDSYTFYDAAMWWEPEVYGDWVVLTRSEDGDENTPDKILTAACNIETGEMRNLPFVNFATAAGREVPMVILGETDYGLLITEETRTRAVDSVGTGGEPIVLYTVLDIYALLDVEDYLNGEANFRTITPVEYTGT